MRIFRIENEEHKGICYPSSRICDKYHDACKLKRGCGKDSKFANPDEGWICMHILQWKFAFVDKATILKWFPKPEGRAAMKAEGAHVVELEIHEPDNYMITTDGEQVLYEPNDADFIAVYDLVELEA